jgi:ABC-type lipoprotein release transport system permease subunit
VANFATFYMLSIPDADALVRVSRVSENISSVFPIAAWFGTCRAHADCDDDADELHGLPPLDPMSYAIGIAGFGMVALVAILLPARRAMSIDPSAALRWE